MRRIASCLPLVLLAATLGGCVFPDEPRSTSNTCDPPDFDLGTGSRYCEATWESTPVVQLSDLLSESDQAPDMTYVAEGDLLGTVQGVDGKLRVLAFRDATTPTPINLLARSWGENLAGRVTSATFLDLRWPGGFEVEGVAVAALDYQRLAVVPLRANDVLTFDLMETLAASDLLEPLRASCERDAPASSLADRAPDVERDSLEIRDLLSFQLPGDAATSYLAVALGCGIAVLRYEPDAEARLSLSALLAQEADALALDSDSGRLFIAAGAAGLYSLDLSDLPLSGGMEDSTPVLHMEIDEPAAHNVTEVRVDNGRVIYVSQATTADHPTRGVSWFVAGTFAGDSLTDRAAIPLSAEDLNHDAARWSVTWLDDNLYGALFNAWDRTDDDDARISFVSVINAPSASRALVATGLPTSAPVESILSLQGDLYALQRDLIYRFTIDQ